MQEKKYNKRKYIYIYKNRFKVNTLIFYATLNLFHLF